MGFTASICPTLANASQAPVAAYSFDEGEGSAVEDAFGENDGTVEGPVWTKGKFGGALEFDGEAGDLVTVPGTEDLQLEEFTIEAWVRPDESDLLAPLVAKLDDEDFGYALYSGGDNAAGRPQGYLLEGEQISATAYDDEALPIHAWSHIAVTNDGAHIRLYVDGELVDTGPVDEDVKAGGEGPLQIGGNEAFEAGEYFSGKIDEVRVYDRALDGSEVAADRGAPIQTPATAPVAAYSFDEGEGEVAEDAFGENDGTIEGAEWFDRGKFGSALYFDGSEGDLVTIPGTEDLQLEEFTVEAWVRPAQSDLLAPVVAKLDDEDFGYALYSGGDNAAGRPQGYLLEGEQISATAVDDEELPEHAWSHIAVTNDGAHIRLYVNGELADTGPVDEDVKAGGEGPLTIGGNEAFEAGEYFSGKIDEVRIYDRALGAGEVAGDMGAGIQTPSQPPVAAYSFEAGEGEVAEDVTGNKHDGTIEGPEWTDRGRFGNALSFNGESEDCVTVPDESGELQLTEELTLEAWAKPSGPTESDPIIFKEALGIGGQPGYAMGIGVTSSGKPEGVIGEEGESENVEGPSKIDTNVWTHLAFTYDGAHMRLYVNGGLVATQAQADAPLAAPGDLKIGCSAWWWEEGFSGKIDEVRIYDRALPEGELRETMTAGFPLATTETATEAEANDAILNGTADANGGETEYYFEYGPTNSYGSVVVGEELGNNHEAIEINEAVVDLAPETTYHYRLLATSPAGIAHGKDQTFTTAARTMTVGDEEELADAENNMDLTASEKKAGPGVLYGTDWTGDLGKMRKQNIYEAVERSGAKMLHLAVGPGPQAEIDYAFEVAAEAGITVVPGLGGGPYPKAGKARTDWIEYAKSIVEKYGPGSGFSHPAKAWVIWNEPNMSHAKQVKDPAAEQGAVNPEGFATFFKEMSEALRSGAKGETAKGEMEVLAPGLYGYRVGGSQPEFHLTPFQFLKRMDKKLLELGSSNAYDAMALHPYVFKIRDRNPQTGKLSSPHSAKDAGEVKLVREAIKQVITTLHHVHSGKPLWITELGFPVANPDKAGGNPVVTKPIQKLLVKASFSMIQNNRKRLNIPHAFYYNIQDDPTLGRVWDYFSGLLDVHGNPRPAWTAYSNLAGGQTCPHAAISC